MQNVNNVCILEEKNTEEVSAMTRTHAAATWILLLSLTLMLLSGCTQSVSTDLEKRVSELEGRVEELENVLTVSATVQEEGDANAETPVPTTATTPEPTENPFQDISLQVTGKNIVQQSYSEFIELPYQIVNNTSKTIRGIEGIMHIKDMFGKTILDVQWDYTDESIPAGESVTITGTGLDYNQFMTEHMKIYSTPYENLVFEYEIQTVLFDDGTTLP